MTGASTGGRSDCAAFCLRLSPAFKRRMLALAWPVLAAPAALAQPATTTLETTVVTATRTERAALDVPASVDVIRRDEVRDAQWRVNLSESLARIPGVVALNRQNYAQDLQISIRGFGARSTFGVRGVRLYLDGIPASMPDGQGQVSHFPLNAVDHIEILRGPFSALYGNSSGGVIAMTTRVGTSQPSAEVSGAAGGYGTWRLGAAAETGNERSSYAVDIGRFATEGYRDHSAAQRDTLNGRAAFDTVIGQLRLSVNAVDLPDAQDPLGLTRAQADDNPRQASPQALQFNTRKSVRQAQAGGELQSDWGGGWHSTAAAWLGDRSVTQFLAIPVAPQLNPNHAGGVIDLDRQFGGLDARVQRSLGDSTYTLGIDLERLNEARRGFENFRSPGELGVIGNLRRDERNTVTSRDVYGQFETAMSASWKLTAGVRASSIDFDTDDHYLVNGNDSGRIDFSGVSPALGLLYRPSRSVSFYASYGRGFEMPTLNELAYRPDGSAGLNTALRPARSHNVELGAKWSAVPAFASTLAVFATRTADDLAVVSNSGGRSSFANAAATRRIGAEVSAQWRPDDRFSVEAAASVIHATFTEPFAICTAAPCTSPTLIVPAGNRLSGVPALTGFIRAAYRGHGVDMWAEWRAQSDLPVDDRNSETAPGAGLVNLVLQRAFSAGPWQLRAFFRIDNLLDARTIGSVIVNESNGRYYEPAPGRSWTVGLDARY